MAQKSWSRLLALLLALALPASARTDTPPNGGLAGARGDVGIVDVQIGSAPGSVPRPPRDVQGRAVTGTAIVRGRVLDDGGTPLARARVRAALPGPGGQRVVITEADGRYEFRDLPRMTLLVTATRAGYTGTRWSREAMRSVTIGDDEVREDVDLVLVRSGAIVGHAFDPEGEPLVGASVHAHLVRRASRGRRALSVGSTDTTDDRGAFRLHSLAPGDYYVSVHPVRSPDGYEDGRSDRQGLAPVFHPGTPDISAARAVGVAAGEDSPIEMTVPMSSLFTVTGRVVDHDGQAVEGATVMLRPRGSIDGLPWSSGVSLRPGGLFEATRVAPGRYTLVARRFSAGGTPPVQTTYRPPPSGEVDIDVTSNIHGVIVRLTDGTTVRGRVTFLSTPPVDLTGVRVFVRSIAQSGFDPNSVALAPDGTFEVVGVRGTVTFMVMGGWVPGDPPVPAAVPGGVVGSILGPVVGLSVVDTARAPSPVASGVADTLQSTARSRPVVGVGWAGGLPFPAAGAWRVRAMRADGHDVTDEGLDVGQDGLVTGVELEVARDFPFVTGVVRDDRGQPYAGALVVAMAVDPNAATEPDGPVRALGRSVQDGRYFAANLPPGTWDLVALADVAMPSLVEDDEASVEWMRGRARRVTLIESQRLTLDLTAVRP